MREDGTRRLLELAIRASRRSIRRAEGPLHAEAEGLARFLWTRYWEVLCAQSPDPDDPEMLEDEP